MSVEPLPGSSSPGTAVSDRHLLEEFLALLRVEGDALAMRDAERLDEVARSKLDCAHRLETHATPALAASLHLTRERLRNGEAAPSPEHHALYLLVEEAARLNRINGAVIAQQLAQVRLSLSRLEPSGVRGALYGRDGQGRPDGPRRSFGLA